MTGILLPCLSIFHYLFLTSGMGCYFRGWRWRRWWWWWWWWGWWWFWFWWIAGRLGKFGNNEELSSHVFCKENDWGWLL